MEFDRRDSFRDDFSLSIEDSMPSQDYRQEILMQQPLKLTPSVQHYAWGKDASTSLVAELTENSSDVGKPYAELWVGAHPKGPATVSGSSNESLIDRIEKNPEAILGDEVISKFGPQLPYLMKVLSIEEVLSIQAHPNKTLAKELRENHPEHYPDANHKPEMGIALSEVEILIGFKERSALQEIFNSYPQLASLLSSSSLADEAMGRTHTLTDEELTRQVYTSLVKSNAEERSSVMHSILEEIAQNPQRSAIENHLINFADQYGVGDIGIASTLVLNYMKLQPGEAVYIAANVPHAYVSGNLIECMPPSDNVVRAGLTPKFTHEEVLIKMLDYTYTEPAKITPQKISDEPTTIIYPTPAQEFEVSRVKGQSGSHDYSGTHRPTLLFALSGEVTITPDEGLPLTLSKGEAALLPAALQKYSLSFDKADLVRVTVP